MNAGLVLASLAGVAIAVQVVANAAGMKTLGLGGLIGASGLTTAAVGAVLALVVALRSPSGLGEGAGRALIAAVFSGVLGSFILGSVVVAATQNGIARTLSLVIASQLLVGLLIDRSGLLGETGELGPARLLGVALILVGGVLVVRP